MKFCDLSSNRELSFSAPLFIVGPRRYTDEYVRSQFAPFCKSKADPFVYVWRVARQQPGFGGITSLVLSGKNQAVAG